MSTSFAAYLYKLLEASAKSVAVQAMMRVLPLGSTARLKAWLVCFALAPYVSRSAAATPKVRTPERWTASLAAT